MIQIPEKTDEKSETYKSGYKNICEIGKAVEFVALVKFFGRWNQIACLTADSVVIAPAESIRAEDIENTVFCCSVEIVFNTRANSDLVPMFP